MAETTPVTLLTGFPGAGKTTLLNHLLRDPSLARSAVLADKLNEVDIGRKLVRKRDDHGGAFDQAIPVTGWKGARAHGQPSPTFPLNNGCPCCTVRGELTRALREMLPRARRGDITRIIIETAGPADPVPTLAALMSDAVVASAYHLDGVITVIDAVRGGHNLAHHPEAARQAAVADRIVISKADLAAPAPLHAPLGRLNPSARIIEACQGQVAASGILHAALSDPFGRIASARRGHDATAGHADRHAPGHHAPGYHPPDQDPPGHDPPNRHNDRIATVCLTLPERTDWASLSTSLGHFLAENGDRVLRVKGVLDLADEDRPVALHAIGHLLHPPVRLPPWPADDPRESRIVFITDGLSPATIAAALRRT